MTEMVNIADMGGWGAFLALSFYIVMAFSKGWIRTAREMAEKVELADKWEAAWRMEMQINDDKAEAINEMLENSRTTVRVLEAIRSAAEEPHVR